MAVLNDDVNQLERFLDIGANEVIQLLTTVVLIGAAFFLIAPSVAWLAFLPTPVILGGSLLFQKRIEPRYALVRDEGAAINSQLANSIGGIFTIKAFTAEDREADRIAEASNRYRAASSAAIRISAAFTPLIRIAILVGFTATLVWGGFLALDGTLNIGLYSVMVFLTQRLLWPLTRLGQTWASIREPWRRQSASSECSTASRPSTTETYRLRGSLSTATSRLRTSPSERPMRPAKRSRRPRAPPRRMTS